VTGPRPFLSRRAFVGSSAAALVAGGVSGATPAAAAPVVRPDAVTARPNVRITRDDLAAHIEPSVAANPRDSRNLLAAFRVFEGDLIGIATCVSFDGGRSWLGNGLLPGLDPDFDGNAVAAFDAQGSGFVAGIEATTAQPRRGDVRLWRTDDGGRSFERAVTAIDAGGGLADHPGLAIDRWAGRPGRPGRLYLAAVLSGSPANGLIFSRSADGGRHFEQPRFIDPVSGSTAVAPVVAAGPGGAVCVVYMTPSGDASVLTAVSSADHGETFGPPAGLASVASLAPGLGEVTMKSGPAIAASPASRYVYAAVTSFDEAAVSSQILLCCSPDGGRSWSAPVPVAASSAEIYLQPQLAVAADGRVGLSVCALGISDLRINVLLYRSRPGPPRFGASQRVTTRSFDPTLAIDTGSTRWLGNYQGLTASGGAFHPIWTDTRTGSTQIFTATVHA
jgi:hypothetical protein